MAEPRRRVIEIDGAAIGVAFETSEGGELRALVEGTPAASVRVLRGGASPRVLVDGRVVALTLASERVEGAFVRAGVTREVRVATEASAARSAHPAAASSGRVTAPMPGRVVAVRVALGDAVERGAALVVIEAMKMQNELFASAGGVVKSVLVRAGDAVERGALLVEIG